MVVGHASIHLLPFATPSGQLYDVITDYIFLFTMVDESNNGLNPASNIDVLIAIGAGSIGAAFVINLLLTAYILLRERRRPAFAKVEQDFCRAMNG